MKNLFNDPHRATILRRIDALGPDAVRRWGTLSLGGMLCHCGDQLRLALGEIEVPRVRSAVAFPPLRWFVIHLMPWPKGVKTAPALLSTQPAELDADRQGLRELIDRFTARGPDAEWNTHPIFGDLSGAAWGVLAYRHLDHHLRQFSV